MPGRGAGYRANFGYSFLIVLHGRGRWGRVYEAGLYTAFRGGTWGGRYRVWVAVLFVVPSCGFRVSSVGRSTRSGTLWARTGQAWTASSVSLDFSVVDSPVQALIASLSITL